MRMKTSPVLVIRLTLRCSFSAHHVRHRTDVALFGLRVPFRPRTDTDRFPRLGIEIVVDHSPSITGVVATMGRLVPSHCFLASWGDVVSDFSAQIGRSVVPSPVRHRKSIADRSDQIDSRSNPLRLSVRMVGLRKGKIGNSKQTDNMKTHRLVHETRTT